MQPCPICLSPAQRFDTSGDYDSFSCPSCGKFGVSPQAVETLAEDPALADLAAARLQQKAPNESGLVVITRDDLE